MHISVCNGELSILSLQSSTRIATDSFGVFSNLYQFYLCLFVCSKQVGFLWLRLLLQKQKFSIVWRLKTTLVSKTTSLKMRFLLTWIIVKVTKTSNNVKSRVLILATPGSVYSPRVATSVMLRIK